MLTSHSLNLTGIDLDNLDIDQFVINNRDFLDCSLESIFTHNIEGMSPYFGMHKDLNVTLRTDAIIDYKRIDLIKNSIKRMLTVCTILVMFAGSNSNTDDTRYFVCSGSTRNSHSIPCGTSQ